MAKLTPEQADAVDVCKEELIREFFQDEWLSLARMVLTTVPSSGEGMDMNVLAQQYRDQVLNEHSAEHLDLNEPWLAAAAFRHNIFHDISAIQRKLLHLFMRQRNPQGFMLFHNEEKDCVRFETCPVERLEQYIASYDR